MLFTHLLQNTDICWFLYGTPVILIYDNHIIPLTSLQYAPSIHEQVFISQNCISYLRMTLLGLDPTISSMFSLKYTRSWCRFQNAIEKTHHCVTAEFPLWRLFGHWFEQPSHSGALSARNGLDAVMFSFIFNSSSENYTCSGHRSLRTPGTRQA